MIRWFNVGTPGSAIVAAGCGLLLGCGQIVSSALGGSDGGFAQDGSVPATLDAGGVGGNLDGGVQNDAGHPADAGPSGLVCLCQPAVTVAPQDTVRLSADCASGAAPLEYLWTVERRPPGSTEPLRDPARREVLFVANTATTPDRPYVFRVIATDSALRTGQCETTVFAVPRDALHLQLTWDRDRADIDIHLLRASGVTDPWSDSGWFSTPNDAFFANGTPEWGLPATSADNPRLDLDDVDGFGPENINIARPASGTYRVGVHYQCDAATGATRATLRVFCNGALAAEFGAAMLAGTGVFWEVATISWPGCVIAEVARNSDTRRGCGFQ
jgi:hypothetical protein